MPPVEIVSRPSSSQRALACSTSSAIVDADERAERERALVLDARGSAVLAGLQDPLAADRARRAGSAHSGPVLERERGRLAAVVCAPGSAESALNVSRLVSVPSATVFRRRGPERARAAASTAPGLRDRALRRVGAHRDGLQPLGAHDRTEAAAAGVAAVVRDGRVADEALTGRADRGNPVGGSELRAQPGLGLGRGQAQSSVASMIRVPSASTTSADGVSQAPRTTIAS